MDLPERECGGVFIGETPMGAEAPQTTYREIALALMGKRPG